MIYDFLFEPLVDPTSEPLELHTTPHEVPSVSLSDYSSLMRTCREIHNEATELFIRHYVPRLSLLFSDPAQLYKFTHRGLSSNPRVHDSIRFCIRTDTRGTLRQKWSSAMRIRLLARLNFYYVFFSLMPAWSLSNPDLGHTAYARDGTTLHVYRLSGAAPFVVTVHQMGNARSTTYTKMTGKVADVDWNRIIRPRTR
ncbi:hypothetical protein B0A55_10268 [Friedmanniomyces simplex]|uniref:Uncharacterized protein n=1 Tax=Friedmanniomyces simplex TaxID=329884 RepID=A0A4U0WUW0_9PEZI|nr:hypothetical protein B0A55_10268 [Friedmanniomyces simplex]